MENGLLFKDLSSDKIEQGKRKITDAFELMLESSKGGSMTPKRPKKKNSRKKIGERNTPSNSHKKRNIRDWLNSMNEEKEKQ